jgi:hypothetical protein
MSALVTVLRRPWALAPQRPSVRLELVREPARDHTLAYALGILTVLAVAVFGAVALNALVADGAVRTRAVEQRIVAAEHRYADLLVAVTVLEDPARIRAEAVELGLVPAGPARIVRLERGLDADGVRAVADAGALRADPLKPVLSVER